MIRTQEHSTHTQNPFQPFSHVHWSFSSLRSTLSTAYSAVFPCKVGQETKEFSLYDPNLVCDKLHVDIKGQNKIIMRYEKVQDGISIAILPSF